MSRSRRGGWRIGAAALGCVAIAACGSVGAPSGTVTNGSSPASGSQDPALQLARCMRSHGVPNFPDPKPGAGFQIGGPGLDPKSPAFQAAQASCKRFLPNAGAPRTTSPSRRGEAVAFAKCMRTHGEPDFPDPLFGPPSGATRVLELHGMAFALGPGIDPMSPAFKQAAQACGIRLPTKLGKAP
jgi:hypothetical protein